MRKTDYPGSIWADRLTQARNLSKNRLITFDGVTRCLSEWSEISGVSVSLILGRLVRLKWPLHAAVFTPVGEVKRGPKRKAA